MMKPRPQNKESQRLKYPFSAIAVIALSLAIISVKLSPFISLSTPQVSGISQRTFQKGEQKCAQILFDKIKQIDNPFSDDTRSFNPRFNVNNETTKPVLIKNAIVIDGDGKKYFNVDILLKNGMIKKISKEGESITPQSYWEIVDVKGRFVTPGLVDMHSHMGTDSWPGMDATSDTNEISTTPLTPFVRSIDGFNPEDLAIKVINSGGVTTSLVLPGSGNLIGGEAYVFKHRKTKSNTVNDMSLYKNDIHSKHWRFIKMACGENIKNSYGKRGIFPESRMGEGYLFRQAFSSAKRLMEEQDDWCSLAEEAKKNLSVFSLMQMPTVFKGPFPEDIDREILVALLRGDVKLHNHCYTTYDIEMMIRHMHEFGFKVTAFHHALDAWKVAPLLAKENITAAIFADLWGYKKEAYGSSVHASEILTNSGAKVAFKSDHPVLNAQHLIFEAQKGHHYGLSEELAIKAVTSVPAEAIGADWRIGFLRQGYDADVVVWNKFPLEIGAYPLKVWVDGFETFTHDSVIKGGIKKTAVYVEKNLRKPPKSPPKIYNLETSMFALTNISKIFVNENTTLETPNLTIIISNEKIFCIGSTKCHSQLSKIPNSNVFNLNLAIITPGLIAGYGRLGLEEIAAEKTTTDGQSNGYDLDSGGTRGVDGLRPYFDGSLELQAAYNSGVLTAVSLPRSAGLLQGLSVSFRTGSNGFKNAVVKEVCGVTVVMGNDAKNEKLALSWAGQLSLIRGLLSKHLVNVAKFLTGFVDIEEANVGNSSFFDVLRGELILFVEAQDFNDISRILNLKSEIETGLQKTLRKYHPTQLAPKIKMTIVGGAEAWVVAEDLALSNVPVILRPPRCTPGSWATRRCKLPSTSPSAIDLLRLAGVKVSFANVEDNIIRNLIFEAAWAHADSNSPDLESESKMSESEAIGLVTWNAADSLGVTGLVGRIDVGRRALLAIYDGSPLVLGTKVSGVVDGGVYKCDPVQI